MIAGGAKLVEDTTVARAAYLVKVGQPLVTNLHIRLTKCIGAALHALVPAGAAHGWRQRAAISSSCLGCIALSAGHLAEQMTNATQSFFPWAAGDHLDRFRHPQNHAGQAGRGPADGFGRAHGQ